MIRLSNLSNLYYISELAFIIDWITFLLTMVKFILRAHICKECSSHRFTTSIQFSIFDYATQHIYIYEYESFWRFNSYYGFYFEASSA